MNFLDKNTIEVASKNFGGIILSITKTIFYFFLSVTILIVVLPAIVRTYFNLYPITELEYTALARFTLFVCILIFIIYFTSYHVKKLNFKKKRLLYSTALLEKKRLKLEKEIEELKISLFSRGGDKILNKKEEKKEEKEEEIETIPDPETCKKIIIKQCYNSFSNDDPFIEKKVSELSEMIFKKFNYNYEKAYEAIFIKKEFYE